MSSSKELQNANEKETIFTEGVKMLQILRTLGDEDQRIAFAVLQGMRIQKMISSQERTSERSAGVRV